jgi:hypothetical protein
VFLASYGFENYTGYRGEALDQSHVGLMVNFEACAHTICNSGKLSERASMVATDAGKPFRNSTVLKTRQRWLESADGKIREWGQFCGGVAETLAAWVPAVSSC